MEDCIFCKIINKEIPSKILYEDDLIVGFEDINPETPVHVLIVPKKHIISLKDIEEEDINLIGHIHLIAAKIAVKYGIEKTGYRVLTNCGCDAGQTISHLHFHLLGGRKLNNLV